MTALPDKDHLLRQVAASRGHWRSRPSNVTPEPTGPGEESVWDYPRPPVVRPADALIVIKFGGKEIARSERAVKVCETAGAPVYYLPPDDVAMEYLKPAPGLSVCKWKGAAIYFDLSAGGKQAREAAFAYPDPFDDLEEGYQQIAGWIGFYPGRVDAAWVDGEKAQPQAGGLYAGWITKAIKGPVKGAPGTGHW